MSDANDRTSSPLNDVLANLGLTSCDFVGDSGCSEPACPQCHPAPPRAEPFAVTDDRPSIAELWWLDRDVLSTPPWKTMEHWSDSDRARVAVRNALPVLLEIAATGLAWAASSAAAQHAERGAPRALAAMQATRVFDAHRAALAKVRP